MLDSERDGRCYCQISRAAEKKSGVRASCWESAARRRGENRVRLGGAKADWWAAESCASDVLVALKTWFLRHNLSCSPRLSVSPAASERDNEAEAKATSNEVVTVCTTTQFVVPALECTGLESLDCSADALFLSGGGKHRQHYQRPQLAPALHQVSTRLMPASVMSQRLPYLPRPLGFIANLLFMAKLWSEDKPAACQGGQRKKVTLGHQHSSLPHASQQPASQRLPGKRLNSGNRCKALY